MKAARCPRAEAGRHAPTSLAASLRSEILNRSLDRDWTQKDT
jgi:hypothetical protein